MISFTIEIEPISTQFGKRVMVRNGKPLFFSDKRKAGYQNAIASLSRRFAPSKPLEGALVVSITFFMRRPKRLNTCPVVVPHICRPDRDNLLKGTQDALSKAGFWKDDAQIFDGRIRKIYHGIGEKPRILVEISEW